MAKFPDQIDSFIRVVTPENIAFRYEVAGPFRRLPAFLIDVSIRIGIAFSSMFLLGLLGIFAGGLSFGLLLLVWFVLEWFYGALFETFWNGQTPGKKMLGIRVLRGDGRPVNGLQAVLRNILRAVDMMPVIPTSAFGFPESNFAAPTFLVGLFTSAANGRYQRLGDIASGTMVIVEERHRLIGVSKLDAAEVTRLAADLPANLQVSRDLAKAVSAYVERRKYFSPARRREIARHIAIPLMEKYRLPADISFDLILCALYQRVFVSDQLVVQQNGSTFPSAQPPASRPAAEPTARVIAKGENTVESR